MRRTITPLPFAIWLKLCRARSQQRTKRRLRKAPKKSPRLPLKSTSRALLELKRPWRATSKRWLVQLAPGKRSSTCLNRPNSGFRFLETNRNSTESIRRAHKIFGPRNAYVVMAKRLLATSPSIFCPVQAKFLSWQMKLHMALRGRPRGSPLPPNSSCQ